MNRRRRATGPWVQPFAQIRKGRGVMDKDRSDRAFGNPQAMGVGEGEAGRATQDCRTDRVRPVILYRSAEGTRPWMAADLLDQVWKIEWVVPVPDIREETGGRLRWKAEVEVQRATLCFDGDVRVEGNLRVTGVGPALGSLLLESRPLHYERRDIPFALILGEGWFSEDPGNGPAAVGLWKAGATSPSGPGDPAGLPALDQPGHVTTSDWRAQVLAPSQAGHRAGGPPTLWIQVTGQVALWIRAIRPVPEWREGG